MSLVPEESKLIIVTTFDSSLFNREDESYQLAISTIEKLQNSQNVRKNKTENSSSLKKA